MVHPKGTRNQWWQYFHHLGPNGRMNLTPVGICAGKFELEVVVDRWHRPGYLMTSEPAGISSRPGSPLRRAVLHAIHTEWYAVAAEPDNHKIMGTPPSDITIFESSAVKYIPEPWCDGDFCALFTYDRKGRTHPPQYSHPDQIATVYKKAYWEHACARFHILELQGFAVLELVFGPRYGRGYTVEITSNGCLDKKELWRS